MILSGFKKKFLFIWFVSTVILLMMASSVDPYDFSESLEYNFGYFFTFIIYGLIPAGIYAGISKLRKPKISSQDVSQHK